MNVVGVQYLVIMKVGVAIYNYMISDWNRMVSMKMLIKIVDVHNFTKDWHSILEVAKHSCLAVLSPINLCTANPM